MAPGRRGIFGRLGRLSTKRLFSSASHALLTPIGEFGEFGARGDKLALFGLGGMVLSVKDGALAVAQPFGHGKLVSGMMWGRPKRAEKRASELWRHSLAVQNTHASELRGELPTRAHAPLLPEARMEKPTQDKLFGTCRRHETATDFSF